jgi:lipopolysaccharide assembly protein A
MRWVYLTVVILFVAATLVFVFQNVEAVTMSFLGLSIRAPLAVLAAVAYILGALSGGSLFALLRKSVRGSRPSGP